MRLLRSQLRSKSNLRVIEADALSLTKIAADEVQATPHQRAARTAVGRPGHRPLPAEADGQLQPVAARRKRLRRRRAEAKIRNEKDLEKVPEDLREHRVLEEAGRGISEPADRYRHGALHAARRTPGFVDAEKEVYDQFGRRRVVPVRTYMERKGFILRPKFIFIDGRTGATLYSETFNEQVLYNAQQNTPALSSYFELMDKLVPSFLNALSTQKVRGSRVLLK